MRNYELIKAIYDRCPDMRDGYHYSTSQYLDRCQDIIDLIERERPEIKSEINSVDVKEIERHVGLEIGPDGTVTDIKYDNHSELD